MASLSMRIIIPTIFFISHAISAINQDSIPKWKSFSAAILSRDSTTTFTINSFSRDSSYASDSIEVHWQVGSSDEFTLQYSAKEGKVGPVFDQDILLGETPQSAISLGLSWDKPGLRKITAWLFDFRIYPRIADYLEISPTPYPAIFRCDTITGWIAIQVSPPDFEDCKRKRNCPTISTSTQTWKTPSAVLPAGKIGKWMPYPASALSENRTGKMKTLAVFKPSASGFMLAK